MTFFLVAVFVFMVFWRPQEWLFPWLFGFPLLDIVVVVAALTMLIEFNERSLKFPRRAPQVFLLGGLWFAAIMSHVAHTYLAGVMWTIVPVFKFCFFTFLLFACLDRPRRLRTISMLFVAMSCMMAVHALLQETTGAGFMGLPPIRIPAIGENAPYTRSYFFGIFGDPNDLAQIMATSIPFAFALTWRRSFIGLLLGGAITVLLVKAILATHSRGGMVALLTVAGVLFVLTLPPRWLIWGLFAILLGAMVMFPFSGGILDESAHDRVVFWGQANWAFKRNPIFGVGFNMITDFIERDRAIHNAFVECYAEIGFFGYWFWFALLQLGIVGAYRTRMLLTGVKDLRARWLRRFAGLSIAALMGYSASSYFLTRAFVYPILFLFALLGAVPLVAQHYLPEGHPPLIEFRRHVLILGTIGTVLSITYVYFSIILINKAWYG